MQKKAHIATLDGLSHAAASSKWIRKQLQIEKVKKLLPYLNFKNIIFKCLSSLIYDLYSDLQTHLVKGYSW